MVRLTFASQIYGFWAAQTFPPKGKSRA